MMIWKSYSQMSKSKHNTRICEILCYKDKTHEVLWKISQIDACDPYGIVYKIILSHTRPQNEIYVCRLTILSQDYEQN